MADIDRKTFGCDRIIDETILKVKLAYQHQRIPLIYKGRQERADYSIVS